MHIYAHFEVRVKRCQIARGTSHLKRGYITRKPWTPGKPRKRLRARPDPEMAAWSRDVLERDGWRCRWPGCPEEGPQVVAHHINERSQRPDLRLDRANGAALCTQHHDNAHHTVAGRQKARRLGLLGGTTYERAMKEREAAWISQQ